MWVNSKSATRVVKTWSQFPSAQRKQLKSRSVIYRDLPENTFWFVADGYVKLSHIRSDGQIWIQRIVGRGGFFGATPFCGAKHRLVQEATAHGPVSVIEIDRKIFEKSIAMGIPQAALLIESLAGLAKILEGRLTWQFITPLRNRVATILFDLISHESQRCRHGHSIDVRLTHQDLADLAGATRPAISAILANMKEQQIIEYTRQHICVDRLDRLEKIALA